MIIHYTKEEKKMVNELFDKYEKLLNEKSEEIDRLDTTKGLKFPDIVYPTPPVYPEGKNATKKALDKYDQEYKEYRQEINRLNAENERITQEWLASGTPEWRQAREDLRAIQDEFSRERRKLVSKIERDHFDQLNRDSERIIDHARSQAEELISNRYSYYKKIIETGVHDGTKVTGFSSRDLRVEGSEIWLDTQTIIEDCKECMKLHYEFFRDNPEGTAKIDHVISDVVFGSPYVSSTKGTLFATIKIKKTRKPRSKKELPSYSDDIVENFFMFSTTPSKDTLFNLMSSDGDVRATAKNINSVGHRKQAKLLIQDNSRMIQVRTENAETIIEILGSACQKINGRTAKKILHFIESELYQRTYYKGKMNDDVVSFPLQKMVDKRLYTSVQNARRAFYDASNVLTALRVSATLKNGKKEISTKEGNARIVLFPTMLVENGQCVVRLNRDINWSPFLKDFFLMPDSWWALPDNASDLEYKIFREIRLHKRKVDKDGSLTFNISLQTVATWLSLPLNTKNPKRDVKDPIEIAVKQITDSLDKKNFKINIKTDLNAPLKEYLTGYLEISINGVYTKNLLELKDKQQDRIDKAIKKKEEIVKEASIRSLAETMKTE